MYDIEKDIEIMAKAIHNLEKELTESDDGFGYKVAYLYAEEAYSSSIGINSLVQIEEAVVEQRNRLIDNYNTNEYSRGYIDALNMIEKIIIETCKI